MSTQTITIGTRSYTLVTMPASPGPASIQITMIDTVAVVASPFTRDEDVQLWPGGDAWGATFTMPPMQDEHAWRWEAFLAALQGRANVFQLGDPRKAVPRGLPLGSPVVDSSSSANNLPMTTTLTTRGWQASAFRLLLPGDHIQIGYRLHMVTSLVNSTSTGAAVFSVWPSIRETPADGTTILCRSPVGLFRLADNRRGYQSAPARGTTLSLPAMEAK